MLWIDRLSTTSFWGRLTLNALKAVVSTYHLAIKFPTLYGVRVFRGNQEGTRKWYMEAMNKMCRKAPKPAIVMTIFKVDEINTPDDEIKLLSDLDPQILEDEVRAHPIEYLIRYQIDPEYPERTVMLESKLYSNIRAELEQLLHDHMDVFGWSPEDMPGIDPTVMRH